MSETAEIQGNVIPPAVRRAAERADRLIRDIGADKPPPAEAGETQTETENRARDQQGRDAERQSERQNEQRPTVGETGRETQPAPERGPTASPQPAPAPVPVDDWEQRYNTLQGKYNRELPELNARVRAAEQRASELQTVIAQMQVAQANQAAPMTSQPAPQSRGATIAAEDLDNYGEDLVTAARRWARSEIQPEIETLRAELQQVRGQTQTVNQQVTQRFTQESVHTQLDRDVPNWRELNTDPRFLQWLDQYDGFSGRKRQELLGEAYTSGDAFRTAQFFTAFEREHTAVSQGPTRAVSHTPNGAGSVPLSNLAAPGRGRAPSPGAPAEKRTYTHAEIAAFYSDVQRGRYDGREQQKAQREADIFAAAAEGRIQ